MLDGIPHYDMKSYISALNVFVDKLDTTSKRIPITDIQKKLSKIFYRLHNLPWP